MSDGSEATPPTGARAKFTHSITDPRGLFTASVIVIGVLGAIVALWGPVSEWLDDGPSADNIAVQFQPLDDGSIIRETDFYLLPYGSELPYPGGGGYCGRGAEQELKVRGVLTGAFVRFSIQNTYTGSEAAEIQVVDVSVAVRKETEARDGVIVECVNSGGDVPIYGTVGANDGLRVESNDDSSVGPLAFVLEGGETQLVYVAITPQQHDAEIDLVASVVMNGETTSVKLNSASIVVPSRSSASAIVAHPRGHNDATGDDYWCFSDYSNYPPDPNPCPGNRLFTKDEEHQYLDASLSGATMPPTTGDAPTTQTDIPDSADEVERSPAPSTWLTYPGE